MLEDDDTSTKIDLYDQYCQFGLLPKLLKRYSFDEKIRICNFYSRKAIKFEFNKDINQLRNMPLPWCIETFLLLAIDSKEYASNDFRGKNEKKYLKMINAIWGHIPEALQKEYGDIAFADYFLPATALTQFHLQEFFWYKYYRCFYIFGFESGSLNLKETFKEKFGVDYNEILCLGLYLHILLSSEGVIPQGVMDYIVFKRFEEATKLLTITREEYMRLSQSFVSNPENKSEYIFCVRPSYQYAFILYDKKMYFPLPHLLTQNTTSALYYRLTDHDDRLREKIGKTVLESYLLDIISESKVYDEVFPECTYKVIGGSDSKSPDVMARQNSDCLFLDSKSSTPSIGIRLFDEVAYQKNIEITANNIVKLYKQIRLFPSRYNPFEHLISQNRENYWGAVVVFEDSYIRRGVIYKKALQILSLFEDSDDATWIRTHIKVVSLYEIERLSFTSRSIIDAMKEQIDTGQPEDYPFPRGYKESVEMTNENLLSFKKETLAKCEEITKELVEKKLIK